MAIIKPSSRLTGTRQWHVDSKSTAYGEDFGTEPAGVVGYQFKKPCKNFVLKTTRTGSKGETLQYYHGTSDKGMKFSVRTVHVKDFKAISDYYTKKGGIHIHIDKFIGHLTPDEMQSKRATSSNITFDELIKKDNAYNSSSSSSSKPTPSAKKLTQYYYSGWKKDSTIPFYSNDKDLIPETDTKTYGTGAYKLTKAKSGWKANTRFK